MAREYGQVQHAIWQDADFISLEAADQRLYFLLTSQSSLNYAGVLDLTVARWARYAPDTKTSDVWASLDRLDARRYVLVDQETEEVLVRTFIRNDGLWSNVRMLRVAIRQAHQVQSQRLRGVLGEELAKLPPVAIPADEKKTQAIKEATECQQELDEAIAQLSGGDRGPGSGERQPLAQPLPQPLAQGVAQGAVVGAGAGAVVGAGAVAPSAAKPANHFEGGSHVSNAHEPPPRFADHCAAHADVAVPGKCGDCGDTRKANKARPRHLTAVTPAKRCIVHDTTYTRICAGCRADEIAREESA